jgi:hypothetical protein
MTYCLRRRALAAAFMSHGIRRSSAHDNYWLHLVAPYIFTGLLSRSFFAARIEGGNSLGRRRATSKIASAIFYRA